MTEKIVNTLAALGFVYEDEEKSKLMQMSVPELMKEFVLPRCLCLPRMGIRYPRIDGKFMKLMARHGEDFLKADYELGSVLLELAMQRITKHPELPAINYKSILPDEYKPYSAASTNPEGMNGCPDEPGLWGEEEVNFIMAMLPVCLHLNEARYCHHAETILFQLITKLDADFMWLDNCGASKDEVYQWAEDLVFNSGLADSMTAYCLSEENWRIGKRFYASSRFNSVAMDFLLDHINLDKEVYYVGWKRRVLKLFGLYEKKTRRRIVKELWSGVPKKN